MGEKMGRAYAFLPIRRKGVFPAFRREEKGKAIASARGKRKKGELGRRGI